VTCAEERANDQVTAPPDDTVTVIDPSFCVL